MLIADPAREADAVTAYHEVSARDSSLGALTGAEFIETLLRRRG